MIVIQAMSGPALLEMVLDQLKIHLFRTGDIIASSYVEHSG
jgi:hypothetical protein